MAFAGDSNGSCSEDDVLVPDTRELTCANYPEPHIIQSNDASAMPKNSIKLDFSEQPEMSALHQCQDSANNNEEDASAMYAPRHVTLEALENTKVAVAQFAATALANGADEASLKELAMLQNTLYTLQHQQVFQIQLIQQLQSQVTSSALLPKDLTKKSTPIDLRDEKKAEIEPEKKEEIEIKGSRSSTPLPPEPPQQQEISLPIR